MMTGSQWQILHGLNTWSGATLADTDILLRPTYVGDADLDGTITLSDYALIDAAFLLAVPNPNWINGDFNHDGVVDFNDYALIDNEFINQGAPLAISTIDAHIEMFGQNYLGALEAVNGVPEPASLAILGLGLVVMVKRNRHRV